MSLYIKYFQLSLNFKVKFQILNIKGSSQQMEVLNMQH